MEAKTDEELICDLEDAYAGIEGFDVEALQDELMFRGWTYEELFEMQQGLD